MKARDRIRAADHGRHDRYSKHARGQPSAPRGEEPTTVLTEKMDRLAGQMSPVGQGIADQAVESWAKGSGFILKPSPIGFKDGPVLAGRDDILETPANLMVGSTIGSSFGSGHATGHLRQGQHPRLHCGGVASVNANASADGAGR